jgi:hypothetical protein
MPVVYDFSLAFWQFFTIGLPSEILMICVGFYFNLSLFIFGLANWFDTSDDNTVMVEKFNNLKKKNKRRVLFLTFFFAIPNKVWTKTDHSMFFRLGAFLFMFFLSLFSDACLFLLMWYFIMFFTTGLLAVAYEKNNLFTSAVQFFFFGHDKEAALSYFSYFWG